jgi:hypothetical protein
VVDPEPRLKHSLRGAGIDDTVAFETKVAMAKAMVRRAIAPNSSITATPRSDD